MKKFTSLLIGVSLALAGAAFAQQPEESPAAGKKQGTETTEKAGKTRGEKAAKSETSTGKQTGATSSTTEQGATGATTETGTGKGRGKGKAKAEASATGTGTETGTGVTTETGGAKVRGKGRAKTETSGATGATGTNASAETSASASVVPGGKHQRGEKATKAGAGANAKASPSTTPATAASATAAPTVAASASTAPSVAATSATGANATTATGANATTTQGTVGKGGKKVETQQIQQIKQQHASFRAQPRPDKAPSVTFNANYRIAGSDRWQGPQYEVFRSYHPERHDRNWYHSRHHRVELIGGGYYYFNNGYWYPAWGYDPSAAYYPYDGPIYVGHRAEPPDRVIADVQAELQDMGYYQGEVDGLLGPLTRQALRDYQADHGLMVTEAIDEPTLDALQLG